MTDVSPQRSTEQEGQAGEHWPTTPVQCSCGWRSTDHGETWMQHVNAAALARADSEALRAREALTRTQAAEGEAARLTEIIGTLVKPCRVTAKNFYSCRGDDDPTIGRDHCSDGQCRAPGERVPCSNPWHQLPPDLRAALAASAPPAGEETTVKPTPGRFIIDDADHPPVEGGVYHIAYNEMVDGYRHAYHDGKRVRYSRTPIHPPDPHCPECTPALPGADGESASAPPAEAER